MELAALGGALFTGAEVSGGTALAGLGQALQVGGSVVGGLAAKNKADAMAAEEKRKANEEMVAATRKAQDKRRQAELIESKQVAGAAASGGGVATPTIYDLIGDTEQAGFEAVQSEIALGENRRNARLASAKNYKAQGGMDFAGSIFGGLAKGIGGLAKYG